MRLLDSMHACLNVDEIVRLIACELVASNEEVCAVALACCCKSFEDPVLDVLWRTQVRLFPLLESFPGDVWHEGGHTVSAPRTHFSLSSTIRSDSLSNGSLRRWNGPISRKTLEGCRSSLKLAL